MSEHNATEAAAQGRAAYLEGLDATLPALGKEIGKMFGIAISIDRNMASDEIEFREGEKVVGRIVNIETKSRAATVEVMLRPDSDFPEEPVR